MNFIERIKSLFSSSPVATSAGSATVIVVGSALPILAPLRGSADVAAFESCISKVNAWLSRPIDWPRVNASELTILYQQAIDSQDVTTTLSVPGGVLTVAPSGRTPNPLLQLLAFVLTGIVTTESERAFVGAGDINGIGLRYVVALDGTVTAR